MDESEFQQRLAAWREGRGHGAGELARMALEIVAESARDAPAADTTELVTMLRDRAGRLVRGRPSMTPIRNLLARWQEGFESPPDGLDDTRNAAHDSARALAQESRTAADRAAEHAASAIGPDRTIITLSLSSTVRAVFERLKDRGVRAIICESRPRYEGYKLAAKLSEWAVNTTLITEAQLGLFVAKADLALVGADTLLPDGSVVNKAGTYLLALAARDQNVPFYVCCESFKRRSAEMGELARLSQLEGRKRSNLLIFLEPATQGRHYIDTTPRADVDPGFSVPVAQAARA